MRLRKIRMNRVRGISAPFEVPDLSLGVNVIVGPNASGKTSICRALQATLWPRRHAERLLDVETFWDHNGDDLRAEREGTTVSWQRNGTDCEPPRLPADHIATCYVLGVRDLLQDENPTDRQVADTICVQMSGGYDVKRVIAEGFAIKPGAGRTEQKAFRDACQAIRTIESRFAELGRDEDALADLREEHAAAQRAEREVGRLAFAAERASKRAQLELLEARLREFPEGMPRLNGDEASKLEEVDIDRGNIVRELASLEQEMGRVRAELAKTRLETFRPTAVETDAASERLRTLTALEVELRGARTAVDSSDAALRDATQRLSGVIDGCGVPELSTEALDAAASLVVRGAEIHAKRTATRRAVDILTSDGSSADVEVLRRAADRLRDWLRVPRATEPPALMAWLALGAIAAGFVLAWIIHPIFHGLAGVGVGLLIASTFQRQTLGKAVDESTLHERKFAETGLNGPHAWTLEAVTELLHCCESDTATALYAQTQQAQRELLQNDLVTLAQEEAELENVRRSLRSDLGLDIASDLTLSDLASRCVSYRNASEARERAGAVFGRLESDHASLCEELNGLLGRYGYSLGNDAAVLSGNLNELKSRLEQYNAANQRGNALEEERGRATERSKQVVSRATRIYVGCGLEDGDRTSLNNRLSELPNFRKVRQDHDRCAEKIDELTAALADRGDLLALSREQADGRREEEQRKADSRDARAKAIGEIERGIRDAKCGTLLQEAMATQATARDALTDLQAEMELRAAGGFLLRDVAREHEQESRPAVLQHACEYFTAFTQNRYDLLLPSGSTPEFRAVDTSTGRGLALSELSDGTRVQLLLATRLAFAIDSEFGTPLPLILDEALTTADPARFLAVARSLMVLAGEGRQIFYLTSEPTDARRWQEACASAGAVPFSVIDLAQLRGAQAAVGDLAALEIPAAPSIPAPDGSGPAEYARRLDVPAADPRAPVEGLHVYYLLRDDIAELYEVLKGVRIETLGQWESLAASGRATRFLPRDLCTKLDRRCLCARAIFAARSIGRGRTVGAEVLQKSGAVSETFLVRMRAVVAEVSGDASQLLTTLNERTDPRVRGFRAASIVQLEEYLATNGYLDRRPVLAPEEVRLRAREAIAETGVEGGSEDAATDGFIDALLSTLNSHDTRAREANALS